MTLGGSGWSEKLSPKSMGGVIMGDNFFWVIVGGVGWGEKLSPTDMGGVIMGEKYFGVIMGGVGWGEDKFFHPTHGVGEPWVG